MIKPFSTTGIGSLPHTDADEACNIILQTFDIPFWPQLPKRGFFEFMIPQFSEGVPCLKIDFKNEKLWIEKDEKALTEFYETYTEDFEIEISENYSAGIHTFIEKMENKHFHYLKGQITGPLTFTLGLKDSKGKLIYFDEELREVSLMVLKAKIRWQIKLLKRYTDNIIIFIDEPILSALGTSSYIGVNISEAERLLYEISNAIKIVGGIAGIHCCGNADWPLVIKSDVKIISFDAYDYSETISLYPTDFTEFLKQGGYLAWGIVPTADSIKIETFDSIKKRFNETMKNLSQYLPRDLLISQILLTPSCGTASRSVEDTLKIFDILIELRNYLKGNFI